MRGGELEDLSVAPIRNRGNTCYVAAGLQCCLPFFPLRVGGSYGIEAALANVRLRGDVEPLFTEIRKHWSDFDPYKQDDPRDLLLKVFWLLEKQAPYLALRFEWRFAYEFRPCSHEFLTNKKGCLLNLQGVGYESLQLMLFRQLEARGNCRSCGSEAFSSPKHVSEYIILAINDTGEAAKLDHLEPTLRLGERATADSLYHVRALVFHLGATNKGGHYIAYVKKHDGQWVCCDDTRIENVSEAAVDEEFRKKGRSLRLATYGPRILSESTDAECQALIDRNAKLIEKTRQMIAEQKEKHAAANAALNEAKHDLAVVHSIREDAQRLLQTLLEKEKARRQAEEEEGRYSAKFQNASGHHIQTQDRRDDFSTTVKESERAGDTRDKLRSSSASTEGEYNRSAVKQLVSAPEGNNIKHAELQDTKTTYTTTTTSHTVSNKARNKY